MPYFTSYRFFLLGYSFFAVACGLSEGDPEQERPVEDSTEDGWIESPMTVVSYNDFGGTVGQPYGVPLAPKLGGTRTRLLLNESIEMEGTCIVEAVEDGESLFADLQPCISDDGPVTGLLRRELSIDLNLKSGYLTGFFKSTWDTEYWLDEETVEVFGGIQRGSENQLEITRYEEAEFRVHKANALKEELNCGDARRVSDSSAGELWIDSRGMITLAGFNCVFDPSKQGQKECKRFGPAPEGIPELSILDFELTSDSMHLVGEMRLPDIHFCMEITSSKLSKPTE